MSNKIRVSVSDLRAQAAELSAIASDFENQYRTAVNTMHNMKNAMSLAMAVNMEVKSARMILYFSSLNVTLQQGVTIANTSAESFENTDITLRRLYSDWLPDDVKSTNVSHQEVYNEHNNTNATNRINSITDGEYHNYNGISEGYDYDCYTYAKWAFNELYGQSFSSQDYPNWRLAANTATTETGYLTYDNMNPSHLSDLLSKSYTGDVLQVVWNPFADKSISTPHTMILQNLEYDSVGNVTGIVTLEGNNPGFLLNEDDGFSGKYGRLHHYTVEELSSMMSYANGEYGGGGISVNHSTNYDDIMG